MIGADRPLRRWYHASTRLEHCVRIVYRADPMAVRQVVAPEFEPSLFRFDDGSTGALVCAVAFVNHGFSFRFCPPLKVSGGQIDYAAYGSLMGERGVWFFGSSLESRFALLPRLAWRMPVHFDRVRVEGETDPQIRRTRVRVTSMGSWGTGACDLDATGEAVGRLDGFADADATTAVLSVPVVGWFARQPWRPWRRSVGPGHHSSSSASAVTRFSVWHPAAVAEVCVVHHARFTVLERLGLVARDALPHATLYHRRVEFDVHTPPRRLRPPACVES